MTDKFDTRTRMDPKSTGDHPLRYMTHAKGYVMVRYTGFAPYVIKEKEWLRLPLLPRKKNASREFRAGTTEFDEYLDRALG